MRPVLTPKDSHGSSQQKSPLAAEYITEKQRRYYRAKDFVSNDQSSNSPDEAIRHAEPHVVLTAEGSAAQGQSEVILKSTKFGESVRRPSRRRAWSQCRAARGQYRRENREREAREEPRARIEVCEARRSRASGRPLSSYRCSTPSAAGSTRCLPRRDRKERRRSPIRQEETARRWRKGEEKKRRSRWKEAKPNMAAVLCIPVVERRGRQAGAAPKAAFNASHLPECACTV
ncbi:hypothetical protein KM043_018026 [Ampulex compressa]|nr:hypothetical protein KM043_018026 [Ampulex compressa]